MFRELNSVSLAGMHLLLVAAAVAGSSADQHLLAGAERFREGQFQEALVEFRVAQKLSGSSEGRWYAAAALVKLDRPEEALEEFAAAEAKDPRGDPLLDYYRALACYGARLYLCSDRILAAISGAGPRIKAQAERIRSDIAALLRNEPAADAIDWYISRGQEAVRASRAELAALYFEEVQGLASRRRDGHGGEVARVALAQIRSGFVRGGGQR